MELSACIVVYNGCDEALRAAQTVLQYTRRHPLTLYLVDNASPDGSGARLRSRCPESGALSGPAGPAGGGALPDGERRLRHRAQHGPARAGRATYHFILNPDIQLTADTLSDLADWMAAAPRCRDGPAGARASRTAAPSSCPCAAAPSGPWSTASCRASSSGRSTTDAYLMEGRRPVQTHRGDRVLHRQLLRRCAPAAFRAVGGFDEHYFMYVEDADLTQKMRTQGQRLISCPSTPPSMRGTVRPIAASGPFSGRPGACCGISCKWGFKW